MRIFRLKLFSSPEDKKLKQARLWAKYEVDNAFKLQAAEDLRRAKNKAEARAREEEITKMTGMPEIPMIPIRRKQ